MKSWIQSHKYLCGNTFIIFLLLLALIKIQEFSVLTVHDLQMPFNFNIKESCGRIPGDFFGYILNNFIPSILNLHPNDTRKSYSAFFIAVSFILIVLSMSKSFFLSNNCKKNFLNKPEALFILPISFFLLKIPIEYQFWNNSYPFIFIIIEQHITYAEYLLGLFPFFISISTLFNLFIKKEELKTRYIYIYSLLFFIVAFWNEFYQICLAFIIILLAILFKSESKYLILKNKIIFISFLFGIICFYLLSDYTHGQTIATYDYNLIESLRKIPTNLFVFIKEFILFLLLKKWYLYIPIFILSICLIKNKNIPDTSNSKMAYEIVLFCFSIICATLLTLFCTIFMIDICYDTKYLFNRVSFNVLYINILTYVILFLLGIMYYKSTKKKYYLAFLLIFNLAFCFFAVKNYKTYIQNMKNIKIFSYKLEQIFLTYYIENEPPVYPVLFIKMPTTYFVPYKDIDEKQQEKLIGCIQNYESFYKSFFEYYYGINTNGEYIFENNNTAMNMLDSKLKQNEKVSNEYILYSRHPFTDLRNNFYEKYKEEHK